MWYHFVYFCCVLVTMQMVPKTTSLEYGGCRSVWRYRPAWCKSLRPPVMWKVGPRCHPCPYLMQLHIQRNTPNVTIVIYSEDETAPMSAIYITGMDKHERRIGNFQHYKNRIFTVCCGSRTKDSAVVDTRGNYLMTSQHFVWSPAYKVDTVFFVATVILNSTHFWTLKSDVLIPTIRRGT